MVIRWTAILLALGSSVWAAERLTVGYRQAPPMTYRGASGAPGGFAIAVFSEAARREGVELTWREVPSSDLLDAGLDQSQIDILPFAADTPERRTRYYVSEPWWWWELSLLTSEKSGIRSTEDLRNRRMALGAPPIGLLPKPYFRERAPLCRHRPTPDPESPLRPCAKTPRKRRSFRMPTCTRYFWKVWRVARPAS